MTRDPVLFLAQTKSTDSNGFDVNLRPCRPTWKSKQALFRVNEKCNGAHAPSNQSLVLSTKYRRPLPLHPPPPIIALSTTITYLHRCACCRTLSVRRSPCTGSGPDFRSHCPRTVVTLTSDRRHRWRCRRSTHPTSPSYNLTRQKRQVQGQYV